MRGSDSTVVAALHTACDDYGDAVELVRHASAYLDLESSDRKRRYSLRDDMARNGQEHAGIAVLHELSWPDPATGGRRTRTVLARVLGNSRAAVRLDLLGLTAVDAAFGVPLRVLRGALVGQERAGELAGSAPAVIDKPEGAWNNLMGSYELAADAQRGEASLPDGYERLADVDLEAVERMADVVTDVVVAVSDPARLLELVQKANIRDHLRGNQDLEEEARLLALGAEILDAHRRRAAITAEEATILYGAAPVTQLLDGAYTAVTAEAARRGRLPELVFPAGNDATRAVGAVMGEPTNRQKVTQVQIQQRARVFTALATRGQHNPRAGETIFDRTRGLNGVQMPEGIVTDWIDAARTDPTCAQANALLGPLAVTWLVEANMFGAPRGSDPKGRRTAKDVIAALRADRVRAIGLVLELVNAQMTGTTPTQVDAAGQPVPGTVADRSWFDQTFPPTRRRPSPPPPPPPTAGPPPTPAARLAGAQLHLVGAIADIAGQATVLAEAVDAIVDLCEEHDLTVAADWFRGMRSALDAAVVDLERRTDLPRLRRLVGDE